MEVAPGPPVLLWPSGHWIQESCTNTKSCNREAAKNENFVSDAAFEKGAKYIIRLDRGLTRPLVYPPPTCLSTPSIARQVTSQDATPLGKCHPPLMCPPREMSPQKRNCCLLAWPASLAAVTFPAGNYDIPGKPRVGRFHHHRRYNSHPLVWTQGNRISELKRKREFMQISLCDGPQEIATPISSRVSRFVWNTFVFPEI